MSAVSLYENPDRPFELSKKDAAILRFGKKLCARLISRNDAEKKTNTVETVIWLLYLFVNEGHVCMDIGDAGFRETAEDIARAFALSLEIPDDLTAIQYCETHTGIFGEPGEFKPVICENNRVFYFHKQHRVETALSDAIVGKLRLPVKNPNPTEHARNTQASFQRKNESAEYTQAIEHAAISNLTLITGGPGSGKTSAVINLLAALHMTEGKKPVCYLCAPTGKAVARLKRSVGEGKKRLEAVLPPRVIEAIPSYAFTIHRLVYKFLPGYGRRGRTPEPIYADYVIVDESSMLDVYLAQTLLAAFRPSTRFVLLGDVNQLSSVEAGAVFSDMFQACLAVKNEPKIVHVFGKNFRFQERSNLSDIAGAILDGTATALEEILSAPKKEGTFVKTDATTIGDVIPRLSALIVDSIKTLSTDTRQQYIDGQIILTPLKTGHFGSVNINRLIENRLKADLSIRQSDEWYHGKKIIVTKNGKHFYNGDIGVCLKNRAGELRVYFVKEDGARDYPPFAVQAYETAYALTVHKSQGSEYRRVDLILPDRDHPLVHKEMLYTAVTRARETLTIYGVWDAFVKGIRRNSHRQTKLKEKILAGRNHREKSDTF